MKATIEYTQSILLILTIMGWAIILFHMLRHLDEKRQQEASHARETTAKANPTTPSQEEVDAADRAAGIQRVYWKEQENGFRDIPAQHYAE